jgi:hypothetical protein
MRRNQAEVFGEQIACIRVTRLGFGGYDFLSHDLRKCMDRFGSDIVRRVSFSGVLETGRREKRPGASGISAQQDLRVVAATSLLNSLIVTSEARPRKT